MIRVSLANAFAHRTLRPLHEKHQATPVAVTLDSAETGDIYSGMVATLTSTGTVEICNGTTQVPYGLFALDRNDTINDLDGQPSDLAPFAVWQGGPDAYFRVDAPAFDTTQTYTVGDKLYADAAGLISDQLNTDAVAIGRVVEVVSSTRLIIQVQLPADPNTANPS